MHKLLGYIIEFNTNKYNMVFYEWVTCPTTTYIRMISFNISFIAKKKSIFSKHERVMFSHFCCKCSRPEYDHMDSMYTDSIIDTSQKSIHRCRIVVFAKYSVKLSAVRTRDTRVFGHFKSRTRSQHTYSV